ncbi:JNK1/MAPK8-associated membrane protein-like isoform X2 [Clavelina lepadiformis]|uniref:JNK1/MAPK8-associated membrane protein-like isoform X2 n=1 Tax=Clavelina lepadiformis TaxID=159417 RepID=UPI0040421955
MDLVEKCPGRYCGKLNFSIGGLNECTSCPSGYRTNVSKYCMPCNESLQLYDWLYLGFMAILPLALHWLYIFSVCQHKSKLAVMHILSAPCELCFAGIVSLLLFSPAGTLDLDSCTVRQLSDWYTIFFNPKIKYTTTLHCAQEAVYPLYSIVFVCYLFSLSLSIILRPIWTYKCVGKGAERKLSTKVTYAALYFYPTLMLIHAIAAGLLFSVITSTMAADRSLMYSNFTQNSSDSYDATLTQDTEMWYQCNLKVILYTSHYRQNHFYVCRTYTWFAKDT